jgi:hypothetical protein
MIALASGRILDLAVPDPRSVDIADIALALSRIPRFCGHTNYSVAQHSVHVCRMVERGAPALALAALMHDAHEAYVGDVSTPVKIAVGPAWAAVEARIAQAVRAAFGITDLGADYVKHYDLVALATERRDLMPDRPWDIDFYAPLPAPDPERIEVLPAVEAWRLFLNTFERLYTYVP